MNSEKLAEQNQQFARIVEICINQNNLGVEKCIEM